MKYAFIKDHRGEFSVQLMCEVLCASKSEFYDWLTRDHDGKEKRLLELKMAIEKAHKSSRGTYGSPRIYLVLKGLGFQVSEETVAQLVAAMELCGKAFHTLKTEFIHHEEFATRAEAKLKILEWIEAFYNRQRLHSSLGYKTPVAFAEEKVLESA